MTASITIFNKARKHLADGTFDLDGSTFKVSLHTNTWVPAVTTNEIFADATNELSTANGYTAGGATLASVTWTQVGGTVTWDAADTVWTASGGSIVARYAVIYASGTLNSLVNPLLAYILLDTTPADVTTTTGNTLTLQWNASGILTLA